MKKALFFAGLAAASLALVGCNKEADFQSLDRSFQVILNNEDTRTVNDGMNTAWVKDDQLNAFYAPAGSTTWSSNVKFTVQDAASNLATGTVGELTERAYDWYFLYPYSGYVVSPTGLNAEGTPSGYMTVGSAANGSQQQAGYGSMAHLAGTNLPVYGVVKSVPAAERPVVGMHQIASVVKVNVTNGTEAPIQIMNVALTAPVDIVGTYYLDITGENPAFTPSGENFVSKTATLSVTGYTDLAVGNTASFYLAVKPFTAAAGSDLSVAVTATNGVQTSSKTLSAAAVFTAGKVKELNVNYTKAAVVSDYEWVKKSLESVTADDVFVIVGNNGADYAMSNDKGASNAPAAVSVAVAEDKLMLEPAENLQWTLTKSGSNYTFYPAGKETHLYCTNNNNGLRVGDGADKTFVLEQGYLKNVGQNRYVGVYTASGQTVSTDWRCYTSINNNIKGQTFAFYVKYAKGSVTPDKTFTATLTGADEYGYLEIPATTETAAVVIVADADVAWTATPSDGLTLSATEGTGSANLTATFGANTGTAPRNFSILVGSEDPDVVVDEYELTITQLAPAAPAAKSYPYEEHFATDKGDFTIDDVLITEPLTYVWSHASYNDDKYMKASAYKSNTNYATESWLISPVVDMAGATAPVLTFRHCVNKFFGDVTQEATVWIKQEGGSWNKLTITYPTVSSGNFSAFEAVSVDVSAYAGKKVQVGFKYVSSSENAGTWEVTDFKLAEAATGPVDPTFDVPATLDVEVGQTKKINVTTDSDGQVTYTSATPAIATVAADGTVTGVAAGTANVTVAVAATATYNAASKTVAVTVTEPQTGSHYGKVTTITSGKKYLIAGGNQPKIFGTLSSGKAPGVDVTITDGKIASNATVDAYAVTITVADGKYSIVLPDGKYLLYNSSTNLKASDTASDTWTVGEGVKGVFRFTSTATDSRALAYRAGTQNTFGGYAVSNLTATSEEYSDIDLYELGAEPTVVPEVSLASIAVSGQKTDFTVGDTFTFGGVVTATYSDGSTKNVTDDAEITAPDLSTAGTKNVAVSYTEKEVTRTTSYQVTVSSGSSSDDKVIIIDGSKLSSDATAADTDKVYDDVTVTFSKGAKFQNCPSTATNQFADKAILIGKKGAYIFNKDAIPGKIVKFEVYANKNASTAVTVGINFSDSAIDAFNADAANTFTATLNPDDAVYDCTDKLSANAKYFWFQITNDRNAQVQFKITYE